MQKIIAGLVVLLFLTGCHSFSEETHSFFAMDTYMNVSVYGKKGTAQKCGELIRQWETFLNREALESEHLKSETALAIEEALNIAKETDGAFDPTVAPFMELWGFYTKDYRIPSREELVSASKTVGYEKVTLGQSNPCKLDLGGIGKGYVSDKAVDFLKKQGVTSAILSLGGNIQTIGKKKDGSLWTIGIADPENPKKQACVLNVEEKAVITSGGYQRCFTQKGQTYHHIIDPKTGYPADSDLLSVTVVGTSATRCDALSTALFVMGKEKAVDFWNKSKDFDMILITEDTIYHTKGISPQKENKELVCIEETKKV